MAHDEFKILVQSIVANATKLRDAKTSEKNASVNYACIFSQTEKEYDSLIEVANQLGQIVHETNMGPVFYVEPLDTVAGILRLIKVRKPDPKRPERGDADFTLSDYQTFKKKYLGQSGFGIITRPNMEMIELSDPAFDVLAYFSHPILAEVLGLKI